MISAIGVIIGALVSVVIVVCVEGLRRPNLVIEIESPPLDRPQQQGGARWLRVLVTNKGLPSWGRWMVRESATHCRGALQFSYHDDKRDVFGREMIGRWANSPEPVSPTLVMDGKQFQIFDPQRFSQTSEIDIPPGESEPLDVAVRFGTEEECYGWNNEGYLHNWRNPDWRLPKGRYGVTVTVRSTGQKSIRSLYLDNNLSRMEFRLEQQPKKGA